MKTTLGELVGFSAIQDKLKRRIRRRHLMKPEAMKYQILVIQRLQLEKFRFRKI